MKRIILLFVIVIVAVMIAFMSLPEDPGKQKAPSTPPSSSSTESKSAEPEQTAEEAARDARLEAMKEVYAKLERERRNLRNRLQEVAYYLGQADMPADQATRMREDIGAANRILINPPLLGAFNGVEDIRQELKRIEEINAQLDEFETTIREHGGYEEQASE